MTIAALLSRTYGRVDPLDAELLMADTLKTSRTFLKEYPDHVVTKQSARRFERAVREREKGTPLPYVLGYTVFCDLAIEVNKDVMIPRSTTERMVGLAVQTLTTRGHEKTTVIDVGTGTGCIPIAVAKSLEKAGQRSKDVVLFGIDISKQALQVAKRNAEFHAVNLTLFKGSLLSPILEKRLIGQHDRMIVTAHLPYVPTEETRGRHEPSVTLDGGRDGLNLYRALLFQLSGLVRHNNGGLDIFFECGPTQMKSLQLSIDEHLPGWEYTVFPDDSGKERIVHIRQKST